MTRSRAHDCFRSLEPTPGPTHGQLCDMLLLLVMTTSWVEKFSEEHSRHYYWDGGSGEAAWILPSGATLQPNDTMAPTEPEGWADCTADATALFGGGALQRAYRSIARAAHPDKGGSAADFQSATATRDYLKSPLRFFAHRALHDEARRRPLLAFGTSTEAEASVVRGANITMGADDDGWPRLTVGAAFEPPAPWDRHVWRMALAHAEASTIEYSGDAPRGGYDVCCHFVRGSQCALRPRDDAVAALERQQLLVDAAAAMSSRASRTWYEERDAHYVAHDCPLPPGRLHASVSKPLHLKSSGQWAVVLLVLDGASSDDADPPPTACLVLRFTVRFVPRPPTTAPPIAGNASLPAAFEQLSVGRWCRDGSDLLEGKLDDYTDCDPTSRLCQLTKQCRARCAKRKTCRFYTTYASGFCQLSSRCEDEAVARDASARTFAKRGGAGPAL